MEHLLALHQLSLKDNRYGKKLARLHLDAGKLPEAERFARDAIYIEPYDIEAHELMVEIETKMGNQAGLAREQRVLPILTRWLEESRKAATSTDDTGPGAAPGGMVD